MCPKNLRELNLRKILVIGGNSIGYNLLIIHALRRIRDLAALFKRADLLVTDNSAHMQLASATKCPVAAIFGPANPYRFGSVETKNIIVHSDLVCFPCKVRKRCRKNFACFERISSYEVVKASLLLLDGTKQPLLFDS